MDRKKICAVVPAYNVADILPNVLSRFKTILPEAEIIVIDDGSTDNLYPVLEKFNLHFIRHESNRGKGVALQNGFRKALKLKADYVFTLDADGQHAPEESLKLLHKLTDDKLDIVIGARANTKNMPLHRRISNKVTSWLISLRLGHKISDSQSGYRLIKTDVLKQIKLCSKKFELETELIIRANLAGFSIGFVDISTIYGNEPSSMKGVDIFRFVALYFRSLFWLL